MTYREMIEMSHCVITLRPVIIPVSPNYPLLLLMFHTHQSRFFWPRHQPAAVCLQRHLLWISRSGLAPPLPPQAPNHPAYLQM